MPPVRPFPAVTVDPERHAVDTATGPEGLAVAVFDRTRRYRYRLVRSWDPGKPRVNFVMLNPSTADAFSLDPTNTRCHRFAVAWGFGTLDTTNVFAWRSTDPKGLRSATDPVGPDNDDAVIEAALAADTVVVAWGTHAELAGRGPAVADLLGSLGVRPVALRVTKEGHPGHPLYVRGDTVPCGWPAGTGRPSA